MRDRSLRRSNSAWRGTAAPSAETQRPAPSHTGTKGDSSLGLLPAGRVAREWRLPGKGPGGQHCEAPGCEVQVRTSRLWRFLRSERLWSSRLCRDRLQGDLREAGGVWGCCLAPGPFQTRYAQGTLWDPGWTQTSGRPREGLMWTKQTSGVWEGLGPVGARLHERIAVLELSDGLSLPMSTSVKWA